MIPSEIPSVQLSDSKEIAALLATHVQPQRPHPPSRTRMTPRSSRRVRCQCGSCPGCLENARWDKIFNEKFADPNYYKTQPVRHTSSLSWPQR